MVVGAIVGGAAGFAVLPVSLSVLGLTAIGPSAGSVFSGFQSSGLVSAGNPLATAQSMAMGGNKALADGISGTTTVIGAATGAYFGSQY